MRKITTLVITLMLFATFASAQKRMIAGTVVDEKGDPLPGVSVTIKGTHNGTSSDGNGQFKIYASTGDVLVVTGASLEPTETIVATGSTINISVKRLVII